MDDLSKTSSIASAGMKAQAKRLRVISENLANQNTLSNQPGGDPYRRKLVHFKDVMDREMDAVKPVVKRAEYDMSAFGRKYDPAHPAADEQGYVLTPNVNPLVELMDMREAQRSYEANMNVLQVSKQMLSRTRDLLR
ncbi:Flagellar basal-body rod protein FlgC [Caenispirillum salinarum AK4]|uniref:Flagellar basal-body rod protein FlgC n=1 Tax=Caenispirillum salinarum AK4 TaxID=1238182 RepID=K9HD96_9PROT|nr:flagellar basal body rod protein FlgC [Caenispirillum salinarum]EKV26681.1 Flagellar basal-body rod protein FlgC [Caenispirillum salinarum AK4]